MAVVLIFVLVQALLVSVVYGLLIAGMWRVFEKAGKPGWAAIVPIYNVWLMVEIVKKPVSWFLIILLVPCVGAVFGILLCIELAKAFGQTPGYGVGLALLGPVFFPMLGFGSARYQPEAAAPKPKRARDEDEDQDEEEERPRRRPRR